MNKTGGVPRPSTVAATIASNAARLSDALDNHMRNSFHPESRKSLRKFHASEVSELTGISMSNLRTRHQDGDFPEVETDTRGRRLYSAEDIDQIRHVMARTGRNGEAYLPGRRDGDALQVVSIVNFKGGSSKTTTAIHLAQRFCVVKAAISSGRLSWAFLFNLRCPQTTFRRQFVLSGSANAHKI